MSAATLTLLTGGVAVASLILYALLGGADYGGGLWDLLARGPRGARQRALIEQAVAPVWEANHVWLIIVVVVLFVGFPTAYAMISIALHVPLTLLLLGVILRGTSFTFRHYDESSGTAQARWGMVFAGASVFTPVMLGITLGALSAGTIDLSGGLGGDGDELRVTSGLLSSWLAPLPIATGLFALALFAFLAAVYLTVEAGDDRQLADDFRARALVAGVAVFVLAATSAALAGPRSVFGGHLLRGVLTWPIQIATGVAAVSAFAALWTRRFRLARLCAVAQVSLILGGWAVAQYPYLIAPDLPLEAAAASPATLRPLLIALGAGIPILGPSLYWLLRVFKGQPAFAEMHDD